MTPTLLPASVTIALIQPIYGQGYNILIFLDRMLLLFTPVHFLFWQPGRVGGQYATQTYNRPLIGRNLPVLNINHVDSTDFSDSLFPSIPLIHHSQQFLLTASSVRTEVIQVSSCWSTHTGVSMWSDPLNNVTNEFVFVSSAMSRMSRLF